MADDIDIEEHAIKMDFCERRLLLDCDVKMDPSDDPDIEDSSETMENELNWSPKSEVESTDEEFTVMGESDEDFEEYPNVYPSTKIILGTKPSSRPGAVILGSKPPSQECSSETDSQESEQVGLQSSQPEIVFNNAVVLLEDLISVLSKNPSYCSSCKTLFPNTNALDAHKMAVHSLLVAIEGNNKVEEPELNEEALGDCEVDFEDSKTVISGGSEYSSAETSEIEDAANEEMEGEETASEIKPTEDESEKSSNNSKDVIATNDEVQNITKDRKQKKRIKDKSLVYQCSICPNIYRYKTYLNKHVLNKHRAKVDEYLIKSFKGRCEICFVDKTIDSYNKHVIVHKCNKTNRDDKIIYSKTSISDPIWKRSLRAVERRAAQLYSYQCTECYKKFLHPASARVHNKKYHPGKRTMVNIGPKNCKAQPQYRTLTPKNIVFKCEKCSLHYLTCLGIMGHNTKPCRSGIKSFTCGVCNKLFRHVDEKLHRLQHKGNGKIRYYIFHKNTYERVLYKCWKCEVYFKEQSFYVHRKYGCDSKDPRNLCNICNIHVNRLEMHQQKHEEKNMLKTDFILVDEFITPKSQIRSNDEAVCSKSDEIKRKPPLVVNNEAKKAKVDKPIHFESLIFLYRCEACELSTNSYDHVIDHCQQHINSANYKVIMSECKDCSLNFKGDCLNDHTGTAQVQILSYKYDDLLKPDWLKIFDTIPKNIVDQITSRSKYISRAVKMHVILDGPPELTLYKCGTCKNYVEPATVYNHTHNCDGSTSNFACEFCGIKFSTVQGLEIHKAVHEKYKVTANSYRIVAFNANIDKEFNKKLELFEYSANKHESGTTFKTKSSATIQESSTITSESNLVKTKSCVIRSTSSIATSVIKWKSYLIDTESTTIKPGPSANDSDAFEIPNESGGSVKTYFFQCNKCKTCNHELKFIYKHRCNINYVSLRKCALCGYITSSNNVICHDEWHRKNQSITKNDIKFLAFEDSKIISDKYPFESLYVYYQCVDCKVLLSHKKHIHDCNRDTIRKICTECGYTFPGRTLQRHMNKHLKHKSMTRERIFVLPFVSTTDVEETIIHFDENDRGDDASDDQRPVKDEMYQCSDCKCIFGSISDFTAHHKRKRCHEKNGVKCNICSLLFHLNVIDFHKEKHETSMSAGADIHKLKPLCKSYIKDYTLYKCSKCLIYFADLMTFRMHIKRGHNSGVCQNCDICNLRFRQCALSNHIKNHHEINNLKSEDFNIICPRLSQSYVENGKTFTKTQDKKPKSKHHYEATKSFETIFSERAQIAESSINSQANTEAAKNTGIAVTAHFDNSTMTVNTASVTPKINIPSKNVQNNMLYKNNTEIAETAHFNSSVVTITTPLGNPEVNMPCKNFQYDHMHKNNTEIAETAHFHSSVVTITTPLGNSEVNMPCKNFQYDNMHKNNIEIAETVYLNNNAVTVNTPSKNLEVNMPCKSFQYDNMHKNNTEIAETAHFNSSVVTITTPSVDPEVNMPCVSHKNNTEIAETAHFHKNFQFDNVSYENNCELVKAAHFNNNAVTVNTASENPKVNIPSKNVQNNMYKNNTEIAETAHFHSSVVTITAPSVNPEVNMPCKSFQYDNMHKNNTEIAETANFHKNFQYDNVLYENNCELVKTAHFNNNTMTVNTASENPKVNIPSKNVQYNMLYKNNTEIAETAHFNSSVVTITTPLGNPEVNMPCENFQYDYMHKSNTEIAETAHFNSGVMTITTPLGNPEVNMPCKNFQYDHMHKNNTEIAETAHFHSSVVTITTPSVNPEVNMPCKSFQHDNLHKNNTEIAETAHFNSGVMTITTPLGNPEVNMPCKNFQYDHMHKNNTEIAETAHFHSSVVTITTPSVNSEVNMPHKNFQHDNLYHTNNSVIAETGHVKNDAVTTKTIESPKVIPGKNIKYDNILYKCNCGTHFMTYFQIRHHIKTNPTDHVVKIRCRCSPCGFLFTPAVLKKHKEVHHQSMNLTREDIVVKTVDTIQSGPKGSILKYKLGPNTKMTADNTLYRCTICGLCYLLERTINNHLQNGHRDVEYPQICTVCGLLFTRKSLPKHFTLHHVNNKYELKDFHIYEAGHRSFFGKGKFKDAVSRGSALGTLSKNVVDLHNVSHSSSDGVIIARCDNTKIIFKRLSVSSVNESSKDTVERQTRDPTCTKPRIVDTVNLDSPVSSPGAPETNETVTSKPDTNHAGVRHRTETFSESEECEIVEISDEYSEPNDRATKNKTKQDTAEEVRRQNSRTELETADVRSQNPTFNKSAEITASLSHEKCIETGKEALLKLFKCGACNVHFLKQRAVKRHVLNHKPFDTMEYMECKLCNLQFQITKIEKHVKRNHKNKDFNLAKTLIEEYQPYSANESPKTAIYYAVDKMQSLVSTSADDDTNSEDNVVSSSEQKDFTASKENTRKPSIDSLTVLEEANTLFIDKNDGLDNLEALVSRTGQNALVTVPEYDFAATTSTVPDKKHYCKSCNETFPSNRAKEFHDNLDHFDPMKQCPICNKSMNQSILNEFHLNIRNYLFRCCLCGIVNSVVNIANHAHYHSLLSLSKTFETVPYKYW